MANYKTAIKDIRRNKRRNERNRAIRSKARTLFKNVRKAIEENKTKEEIIIDYKEFVSYIDKSARKGIFHKNFAGRKKSRLMKKINAI